MARRPGPFHRLASRLMFLPILTYDDGYGWTYGGRTSTVNALGLGERLSVPLTWGATRRAALEAERTFHGGPLTRVLGSFGIAQRENPHFDVDDQRTEARGAGGAAAVRHGDRSAPNVSHTNISFGGSDDHFWTSGADVALDTRRDPAFPSDAVFVGTGLEPAAFRRGAPDIDRVSASTRAATSASSARPCSRVHAEYDTADGPLPAYEQWLLGGSDLRGTRAGTFAGDKRLLGSAELRVPSRRR